MKAQLGKPTGLALALLAALLATFFAMGVFSVAQAQTPTHSASRSFSATTVAPGGEVVVTINVSGYGNYGVVEETLPTGFSYVDSNGADGRVRGALVEFLLIGGSVNSFTYTVTASDTEGSYRFDGDFETRVEGADISVDISGATTVTVAAATNGGNGEPGPKILSSQEPGAAVRIEIDTTATAEVSQGEDISIKLGSFDLPDTISESHVLFSDGDSTNNSYIGNPSEARVSGSDTIILTVPVTLPNGNANPKPVTGPYKIVIKQSAGITNPTAGGEYTVEVDDADDDNDMLPVDIDRVIKLDKTSGTRGTMTTATFKGFSNGTATIYLNDVKLDEVTIADNAGTLEIDTTSSKFKANREGGNEITATDGSGIPQDVPGKFTINPKVVLDPEETFVSKNVTIKLSDWPLTHPITKVTIGATPTDIDQDTSTDGVQMPQTSTDGKAEFSVQVPHDVNRGSQTVKVTGTDPDPDDPDVSAPSASTPLKVGVLSLEIQPASAVPGQEITIQAGGFVAGDEITSITIGNQTETIDSTANSGGDVVISLKVPSPTAGEAAIGDGDKTVTIKGSPSSREGEGTLTILKATITVAPDTARRGETVQVNGSGFPAGDLVQIMYQNLDAGTNSFVTVTAKATDSTGVLNASFVVPSFAQIGKEHKIKAASVGVYKPVEAEGTHSTPGATLTMPAQATPGTEITISGMNFPAFAAVGVLKIGTIDARPVPAPATSIDGDFSTTILVPQTTLGNQTVTVTVSGTTITAFLELVTATVAAVTDPAELFMPLGDRLVRVWYLERSTQVWSFYDPDSDVAAFNTLTEVSSGQNVSIIISSGANIGFQDKTLYPGTNPIALD